MTVRRLSADRAEVAARRFAGSLAAHGVVAGDRVVVVASSSTDLVCFVYGALRRGIVPVLLNPALLAHEQADLIADAEAALVVRDSDLDALRGGPEVELAPHPLARPMHYTSGTTGRPKGVWSGVLDDRAATMAVLDERELWHFDSADTHLVLSPLHHSAPVRFALGTLLAGGDVLVMGRFDAAQAAALIAAERPTTTFCVPAHLERLFALAHPPPFDSFRLVAHAGAPCPPALKRRAIGATNRGVVHEFYGSTEGQFTACSPAEWLERPGTVGRARPGRQLHVGVDGRIWCRVPPFARFSYWRDARKTADAWDGDAFTVHDVGRLDDEGYLFLDGRRDDLVITGGVNVYPAEVERVIAELPGVEGVAVFGADDAVWGQRVCAAVVGEVDTADVVRHCRARLAPHKRPKDVLVVDSLPVSETGKIRRSTLAAELGVRQDAVAG